MRRGALIGLAVNAAAVALGLVAALAHAYFDTSAVGVAAAATSTLSAPGNVSPTVSGAKVVVTWSAASVGGTSASGYEVERYDSSGVDLGDASCSPVPSSAGTPDASGTFSCTDTPGPGSFQYVVTADWGQSWSTDAPLTSVVTVTQGTRLTMTSPSTSPMGSPVAAGSLVSTLGGAAGSVSGTITYRVFGPQASAPTSCASGGTAAGTATVTGNGPYTPPADVTPSATGTYWWYASYGGDGVNTASASTCGRTMPSTVVKYAPQATVTGPAGSSPAGTQIPKTSFSLALSGAGSGATGTMYFYAVGPQSSAPTSACTSGKRFASATAAGSGTYTASTYLTPTVAGTYWLYGTYPGDSANFAAASACATGMTSFTVTPATPTMTTTVSSTAKTGQTIASSSIYTTFGASTYSGTNATGTITFTVFPAGVGGAAPTDCSSGGTTVGTATVSGASRAYSSAAYVPPSAGNYYWQAAYSGDANNNAAASACGSSMPKTTVTNYAPTFSALTHPAIDSVNTAVPASALTSTLGTASTMSATASGTITYTVFGPQASAPASPCSGGTAVGTSTVNGPGSYASSAAFTPTSPGNYWWWVGYGGDAADNAVTAACPPSTHLMTVWGVTTTATAQATSGNTIQLANVTLQSGTPYLLLYSRDSGTAGDSIVSVTGSGFSPAITAGTVTTQNFGSGDFQGATYLKGTAAGTGTITVKFTNALAAGRVTQVALVALAGASSSAPTASNVAPASGSSTTASTTALGTAVNASDATLVLLSGDGDLGASAPTAAGLSPIGGAGGSAYLESGAGSLAAYVAIPGQQGSLAFTPFDAAQGWGSIAVELKHG